MILFLPLLLAFVLVCTTVAALAAAVPAALLGWLTAVLSGRLAERVRLVLVGAVAVGATAAVAVLLGGSQPGLAVAAAGVVGSAAEVAGVLAVRRSAPRPAWLGPALR
ncbi:hypothetical protein ACFW1A_15175 [Kitasatospora sp. NPDC058965]|uniref:hypothetical protein n=1 Tax=Kitasatospora sp. NPDC058965 TaxID=3346682 RepID=UPI00367F86CA